MTDDNSTPVDMDDLDKFSDAFYGKETPEEEPTEAPEEDEEIEEVDETEDDDLATEEDTDAPEGDDEDDEAKDEDEPEPEPDPKPKKNRKSFQNRIDELTAKAREAERREAALIRRLDELEARRTEVKAEPEPTPLREQLAPDAPQPDAVDKDGNPVFELGEFDPKYIAALSRYTVEQELKAQREKDAQEARQREIAAANKALQDSWHERVEKVEEELPDVREHIADLANTFADVDPQYGEYLATTIMQCDNGPEIMYYLSQNIGEAQKIVASGPYAATLAIGRLQAKLEKPTEAEQKRNTKRVSAAPNPVPERTKGRGAQTSVRADTDDLDAFSKVFFSKR